MSNSTLPLTTIHSCRQLLLQGKWFSGIPPLMQQGLCDAGVIRKLVDGERLFSRGDPSCGLYAVIDGVLRISGIADTPDSPKEAVLSLIEPPEWFGELGLIDRSCRTHDVCADGTAVVLHVPQKAILRLLALHPGYWRDLGALMARKLRLAYLTLENNALQPAPVRLQHRLLLMAEGYGSRHDGAQQRRILKVSQEQLACLLALSRQTTNQILKGLEQKGIIRLQRNQIEIVDFEELRGLVPPSCGGA